MSVYFIMQMNIMKSLCGLVGLKSKSAQTTCSMVLTVILVLGVTYFLYHSFVTTREGFKPASELMLLHMTGCGHCVKLMPEWDKFVGENSTPLKTTKVEQGDDPTTTKKHGVKSFPTILLLDGQGNKIDTYKGPRTAAGLHAYAKSKSA